MASIFADVIAGKIPAEKVFEDDHLIAIKDIHPVAPVHLLIISKKEIKNLQSLEEADLHLLPRIAQVAQELAEEFGVPDNYRLLTNNGSSAGQTIFHLHFHLIGGRRLGPMA